MFKKKMTLQECEQAFNQKQFEVGSLKYQIHLLEGNVARALNEMGQLANKGKDLRAKIKGEAVDMAEAQKKKEENAIN
jgi:hypothetical protein